MIRGLSTRRSTPSPGKSSVDLVIASITVLTSGALLGTVYKLVDKVGQYAFAWKVFKTTNNADDAARVVLAFQGKGAAGPWGEPEGTVLEGKEAKEEPPAFPP